MASRSSIPLSPPSPGGSSVDAWLRDSGKVSEIDRIGGGADDELLDIRSSTPADGDYGAVTRPIPSKEVAGVGVGAAADAEATGSGSVIALLKRLRTLLNGGLPTLVSTRLPVDGSGVTLTVSGTVGIGSLPNEGQQTMANSVSVAVASDQSALPVSVSSSALPSGAASLAEQQTQTTALQLIDDIAHEVNGAISKVAAIGAQYDDTATTAATENAVAPLRISDQRALHVQLRSGSADYGTSGAPLRVDPTGSTTQPVSVPGTVSTKTDLTGNAPQAASVGAAEAQLLAANSGRKGLTITNTSASGQRLSLAFDGQAAVANAGITLRPGDVFWMDEFSFTDGEVRWVGSAASTTCGFQEFI